MQQQEPNGLSPAQRELEAALRTLGPSPASVDAVAAAFSAGRKAVHRQVRAWQTAAVLMLMVGTSSWLLPHRSGGPAQPHNAGGGPIAVVQSQPSPSPAHAAAPPPQSLLMLQRTLWQQGVEGLPATRLPPADATQPKDTL